MMSLSSCWVSRFSCRAVSICPAAAVESEPSKFLAAEGSLLPTYASVYTDPAVTKTVPWFQDAAKVVVAGKSRPMSKEYGQVSDTIRTTTSAILARTKTPAEGVDEIENRLRRVMR